MDTELIEAAQAARARAYAPYSGYRVGAAVRTDEGRIFAGVNVENASYGLTVCAERVAVFGAIAAGAQRIVAVAVVTDDDGTPCGACRQVLAEFADDDCAVLCGARATTLGALLPDAFRLKRWHGR